MEYRISCCSSTNQSARLYKRTVPIYENKDAHNNKSNNNKKLVGSASMKFYRAFHSMCSSTVSVDQSFVCMKFICHLHSNHFRSQWTKLMLIYFSWVDVEFLIWCKLLGFICIALEFIFIAILVLIIAECKWMCQKLIEIFLIELVLFGFDTCRIIHSLNGCVRCAVVYHDNEQLNIYPLNFCCNFFLTHPRTIFSRVFFPHFFIYFRHT